MLQILDPAGKLVGEPPDLDGKDLVEMYRFMALGRRFDRRAMRLQRQGRLGTFPPGEGQEAAQVGSAYALDPDDWVYPSYREHATLLVECLDRQQQLGPHLASIELDEIAALTGRRADSLEDGLMELDDAIKGWGTENEAEVLRYLARRAWRLEYLWKPVVDLFPGRHFSRID